MNAVAPSLVWVIVDGEPRHVSTFASLAPRRRPRSYCPECSRQVILKLGDVLRHHAAHDRGDVCAATRPETALHLNCKLALASALRAVSGPDAMLPIIRRCAGAGDERCDETLITGWARAWEAVAVEYRLADHHRPDIVLLREGTPIGALEVVASNAVSVEKAAALAMLGVPWIAVEADERLTVPCAWSADEPLLVSETHSERVWRCPRHATRHAAIVAAAKIARAAEDEAQREAAILYAARVVDLYHPGGARERFIYRVAELQRDGVAYGVRLTRGTMEVANLAVSADASRESRWPELRVAFKADVRRLLRSESFADSPMRWAMDDAAENIVVEAPFDRALPDPTPLGTTYPRRWFYAKDTERWFLPADMRDARWDRAPLDVFAAHPAWRVARTAVREHPAPEGSWRTPIFASRPVGALFALGRPARVVGDSVTVIDVVSSALRKPRALAIIERATAHAVVEALAGSFDAEGVDAVWVSHPGDWCAPLAPLAWAPGGRDQRGRGAVLIDGVGVFHADQFVRALAKADRRLSPASIRQSMAARVKALGAGRKD